MVYKVNVVTKDNIKEIRYITATDVISENVSKMAEIDIIRDIANNIMSKQPGVQYDEATKLAKQIRIDSREKTPEPEKEKDDITLPGIEMHDESDEMLFGLEPAKQLKLVKE